MSREAWGDPPDTEPQRCPVCDGQEHVEGCELGKEVALRIKAEAEAALLRRAPELCKEITELSERIDDLEKGLNEWRELALSQAGDAGIVDRMVKAETEVALLHAAMRDEMDEGLRLRDLGGALPDENITAMTERVIAERDELRTKRMVDDFVKRDAYRYRKLLMQDKHWLGVFRCDPDGTPSDSISADELSALLDAMDGPEMLPAPEAP